MLLKIMKPCSLVRALCYSGPAQIIKNKKSNSYSYAFCRVRFKRSYWWKLAECGWIDGASSNNYKHFTLEWVWLWKGELFLSGVKVCLHSVCLQLHVGDTETMTPSCGKKMTTNMMNLVSKLVIKTSEVLFIPPPLHTHPRASKMSNKIF